MTFDIFTISSIGCTSAHSIAFDFCHYMRLI
jgi:hypothetical protein